MAKVLKLSTKGKYVSMTQYLGWERPAIYVAEEDDAEGEPCGCDQTNTCNQHAVTLAEIDE